MYPPIGPSHGRNISLRLRKASLSELYHSFEVDENDGSVTYPQIQDIPIYCHFNGTTSGFRSVATVDVDSGTVEIRTAESNFGAYRIGS